MLSSALSLLLCSCSQQSGPTLKETLDWMHQSLATHRAVYRPLIADGKILSALKANGCSLDYVVTSSETVHYDLGDIDPKTIKVEPPSKVGPILEVFQVTFKTTNYHQSVRYSDNSTSDMGFFGLDTQENAESFQKALAHAVELCGGKPSTF
jgi:hypothetical protein